MRSSRKHFLAVLASAVSALSPMATATPANAAACSGAPVIVLHDFTRDATSVARIAERTRALGRCTHVLGYGRPRIAAQGSTPLPLGGMEAIDRSVAELAPAFARIGGERRRVDVVAVGLGSLVAARYQQIASNPVAIGRLVGIGTLWHGTNIAGLADLEQSSRDAGTYDTFLPLEQLILDNVCASCREMLTGSDFMRAFWAAGLPHSGTKVTSIISTKDGLVVPYSSGALTGTRTITLQDVDASSRASHFQLPDDKLVLRLVAKALT